MKAFLLAQKPHGIMAANKIMIPLLKENCYNEGAKA